MMDVSIPIPTRNPWRTSWRVTAFLICVSIMASITFQRTSKSPIPQVYVLPLGMRIKTVHPRSARIFPRYHMNWTSSTSFIRISGLGGVVASFFGCASLSHILKCLAHRCVWPLPCSPSKGVLPPPLPPLSGLCHLFGMGRREWGLVSL